MCQCLFQVAYELACQGPVRPKGANVDTTLYSIKCVSFRPPELELEVVCVIPNERFFLGIAQEVGVRLKSSACCSKIRYLRVGFVTLEHALLEKHFNLENVLNSIYHLKPLVDENRHLLNTDLGLKSVEELDQEEDENDLDWNDDEERIDEES